MTDRSFIRNPTRVPQLREQASRAQTGNAACDGNRAADCRHPRFTVAVSNALGGAQQFWVINSTDPGNIRDSASGSFAGRLSFKRTGAGNGAARSAFRFRIIRRLSGRRFSVAGYVTDASAAGGVPFRKFSALPFSAKANAVAAPNTPILTATANGRFLFRPSLGEWWILKSSNGGTRLFNSVIRHTNSFRRFYGRRQNRCCHPGIPSAIGLSCAAKITVITHSRSETVGDIPAPADFDAGRTCGRRRVSTFDATWFINKSSGGTTIQQFGASGDVPVVADYDADGRARYSDLSRLNGEW